MSLKDTIIEYRDNNESSLSNEDKLILTTLSLYSKKNTNTNYHILIPSIESYNGIVNNESFTSKYPFCPIITDVNYINKYYNVGESYFSEYEGINNQYYEYTSSHYRMFQNNSSNTNETKVIYNGNSRPDFPYNTSKSSISLDVRNTQRIYIAYFMPQILFDDYSA